MASLFLRRVSTLLGSVSNCDVLLISRSKSYRKQPTRIRRNPYVARFTDFIKHACITLIKYERLQTTLGTAKRLELYGNMLIAFTQRRRPPPDLCMIKNGFLLLPHEVKNRLTKRMLINRKSKYILTEPIELSEEEYVKQCRQEASNVLLGDQVALDKLYGELAERYRGIEGHYVKITAIASPKYSKYPEMAYIELINNNKAPLPKLPEIDNDRLKTFPRDTGYHFINK